MFNKRKMQRKHKNDRKKNIKIPREGHKQWEGSLACQAVEVRAGAV